MFSLQKLWGGRRSFSDFWRPVLVKLERVFERWQI